MRVVLCGTQYGKNYIPALTGNADFQLVGILAKGSERSVALAAASNVPLLLNIEDLPADVGLACVAVGGAAGQELRLRLLERGLHVLSEHPLPRADAQACFDIAERKGVCFHINAHFSDCSYPLAFIARGREICSVTPPVFMTGICQKRLLYSFIDVIGRTLGTLRPFAFGAPLGWDPKLNALLTKRAPIETLHGVIGGVPLSLQCLTAASKEDNGSDILVTHRLTIGLPDGNLLYANSFGPAQWALMRWLPKRPKREEKDPANAMNIWESIGDPRPMSLPARGAERVAQNRFALDRLALHITTGVAPLEQSKQHLLDLCEVHDLLRDALLSATFFYEEVAS